MKPFLNLTTSIYYITRTYGPFTMLLPFWVHKRTWCWKGLCNKEVSHDQRCLGVQGRRSIFYLELTMCCCMPIGLIQNPKSIHHRTVTGCIGLLQHTTFWHRHFSWLASNGSCTLTSIQCIGDTSISEELSSHDLTRVTPPQRKREIMLMAAGHSRNTSGHAANLQTSCSIREIGTSIVEAVKCNKCASYCVSHCTHVHADFLRWVNRE